MGGYAQFSNNSTGIRVFGISSGINTGHTSPLQAQGGWHMCVGDWHFVYLDKDTLYNGVAYQNSGSKITLISNFLVACRIR